MRSLIVLSLLGALSIPAIAVAQLPAPVDAAPADAPALVAPDPTEDGGGFFVSVKDAFAASKFVGVVLLLWGVARVAFKYQDSISFFNTATKRAILVGAVGLLAAVLASVGADGRPDWQAMLGAVLAQIALYVTPEPKAKAAKMAGP